MIHARGLTRVFKLKKESVEAVRGIDLDVEAGQLVAFLGPNGAGKSTTLRMLTTLLPPTSGTATVAGRDIARDPGGVRARIGYVGQKNSAGENFRVRDELVTQGRCYGLAPAEAGRRADELLDLLELRPLAQRKPGTLSGGQRRRLDIALGLVHRPGLLFLDEPSTGLDPKSRAEVWAHILRLRAEYGTTLFLTTHYLEEADSMAERVVIIDNGEIIADGTAEGLKNDLAGDRITITTATEQEAATAARLGGGEAALRTAAGMTSEAAGGTTGEAAVEVEGTTVRLRVANAATALPEYLRTLEGNGVKVATAETARPTLDDVFLTLTGRSLTDDDIPS
ncbi:ATP-binding cassette domain-containing protein [Nonomuraea sp. NPDC052129]|uniref:ATP-binding cassette domain-containing protein n=1 Tax=Nonomuraea sp. NPDC052129 TaxID=3154651 RepID=UPI00342812E0